MTKAPDSKTGRTRAGNYFVSNYPPFSLWTPEQVTAVEERLARAPDGRPLGIYVHLPFCRKRCDFCYFKVYTDKNAKEIGRYLDAVIREAELAAARPYLKGRRPRFVYFGGGTPSYLSGSQLTHLFDGLKAAFPFDDIEELTFECEPGTLQGSKIGTLHDLGVTRLSLGIENFNPELLEINNRAHRAKEIHVAYEAARATGFPQINLDLIAGMVGETDDNWRDCVEQTLALRPESVTIYQMEVPYNTTVYRRMEASGAEVAPVADWDTKRRWTGEAFARFEATGYTVGSAYTVKVDDAVQFLYRDALWTGADLLGLGVSSFAHLGGVHAQNEHSMEPYVTRVEKDELPVLRAYELTDEERLIREFVLQLKLGDLPAQPFRDKFGVDVIERFRDVLERQRDDGWLTFDRDAVHLTRDGLLSVDALLHDYFLDEHRVSRYA